MRMDGGNKCCWIQCCQHHHWEPLVDVKWKQVLPHPFKCLVVNRHFHRHHNYEKGEENGHHVENHCTCGLHRAFELVVKTKVASQTGRETNQAECKPFEILLFQFGYEPLFVFRQHYTRSVSKYRIVPPSTFGKGNYYGVSRYE